MKAEYDFKKGIKGKFHTTEKEIELPIYLDKKNQNYFITLAKANNITFSTLINKIFGKG